MNSTSKTSPLPPLPVWVFLAMCKERSRVGTDLCDVLVVWIKAQRKLVCICVCVKGADISSAESDMGLASST